MTAQKYIVLKGRCTGHGVVTEAGPRNREASVPASSYLRLYDNTKKSWTSLGAGFGGDRRTFGIYLIISFAEVA